MSAGRRGLLVRIGLGVVMLGLLAVGGWAWWRLVPARMDAPLALPDARPGSADRAAPAPRFVDITEAAGIDFKRLDGARGERLLPETMGGGVAFVDIDNDGLVDVLLVDGGDWPHSSPRQPAQHRLYRNLGGGRFDDVSAALGLQQDFHGMGVAVADVDADGWQDLLLTGIGGVRLLRNRNGRLEDVSHAAGVAGLAQDWTTAASFLDADGDGDLDLFVGQYVQWSREIDLAVDYQLAGFGRAYGPPMNFAGTDNRLYLQAAPWQFSEVSAQSGLQIRHPSSGQPVGKALGVVTTDLDEDGDCDLVVANDTVRNFVFLNDGRGQFLEMGAEWGLAFDRDGNATGAMGIDSGWIGTPPRHALLLGNFANEMSSLYLRQGAGLYSDDAIIEGIGPATRMALTFGTLMFDYDLDGRLDLLQTNGHIEEAIEQVQTTQHYRQPGQLFWNCGEDCARRYLQVDAVETGALANPIVGRGSAYADIDSDGDLDLIVAAVAGAPALLRNDQATGHDWIAIRLQDRGGNRDALGARLQLETTEGIQLREIATSRGYLSAVEPIAHFGLGGATIRSLSIRWPDGARQQLAASELQAGRLNRVERPATGQP